MIQPIWQKNVEFTITNILTNEIAPYFANLGNFFTRSDMRGVKAYLLGEVIIPKSGEYEITYPLVEGDQGDFLSVMSYQGGVLTIFIMVGMILVGSFLALGGLILGIVTWQGQL